MNTHSVSGLHLYGGTMSFTWLQIILCTISLLSAKALDLESIWRTDTITIDGNDSDWTEDFTPIPDFEECRIAVKNDLTSFYMCFRSTDRDINHQIMKNGFIITFISNKKSTFGLQFPTGFNTTNSMHIEGQMRPDPEMIRALEEQMLQSLIITGRGKSNNTPMGIRIADSLGIKVKCSYSKNKFIYELKIPLKKDLLIAGAIDLVKNSSIKFKLETVEPKSDFPNGPPNRINGPHHNGDGMGGIMGGSQQETMPVRKPLIVDLLKTTVVVRLSLK
jgi:hypothetical protein